MVELLGAGDVRERSAWAARFDAALSRLQADVSLSRADRVSALGARVGLARLGLPARSATPQLPAALVREAREMAARLDREVADGYERQAVIPAAAEVLADAGAWAEARALLEANLARSHAPYYLMSQLGSQARKQGRTQEALRWYEKAYQRSEGPATRLQWGAAYVKVLVELAPQNEARIEAVVQHLFDEAAADRAAFHERSARSLQRLGEGLQRWNADGRHVAAMRRFQARLDSLCPQIDAADGQRALCERLLRPAEPAKRS
jgi:hypothetical protein